MVIDDPYLQGSLTIDPQQHYTEEEVLDSLRHELIHLFLAGFHTYRDQVGRCLDETTMKALDVQFFKAIENGVEQVESALDHGLRLPVEKMVKGRQRMDARTSKASKKKLPKKPLRKKSRKK